MSFSVPKNVPSFSNPQRHIEDRLWQASGVTSKRSGPGVRGGGVLGGVQDRVGDLFSPNRAALPMYKDKPYAYAPSGRTRTYRRRRVCGVFFIVVLILVWWTGKFAEHHDKVKAKVGQWKWAGNDASKAKGKHDWLERRKRVVEAMELSWGAYERYAWGRFSASGWQAHANIHMMRL